MVRPESDSLLTLRVALRLSEYPRVAFVGAGGKTTALFALARQLDPPVITTTTTHLGSWQLQLADTILSIDPVRPFNLPDVLEPRQGVILLIGPLGEDDRHEGLSGEIMELLGSYARDHRIPLLIEADGSRMRPLKAPAKHEPLIPDFVDLVVVVAGMSAVGEPLSDETVHRPGLFSELSGIQLGDRITPEAVVKVLCHPLGGLKNIPPDARKVLLLNKADTEDRQKSAQEIAKIALSSFEGVIVASLVPSHDSAKIHGVDDYSFPDVNTGIISIHERVAAIILAAGESRRFGSPKQLLDWNGEPLIRKLAVTALASGLSNVIVVTGAHADLILPVLQDLPITCIDNPNWKEGQSSSIRLGIQSLENNVNSAVFILADQPFISDALIRALVYEHRLTMAPIVAPVVNDQRGNPVLFDRSTFTGLMKLRGNEGGRAIFDRFSPHFLPWNDPRILLDIDTPEDYLHLKDLIDEQV